MFPNKKRETLSLFARSTCDTPIGMERLGILCRLICLSRSLRRLSTSLSIFSRPNLSKAKFVGANMVKGPPSSSEEARSVSSRAFTRTENLGWDLRRLIMLLGPWPRSEDRISSNTEVCLPIVERGLRGLRGLLSRREGRSRVLRPWGRATVPEIAQTMTIKSTCNQRVALILLQGDSFQATRKAILCYSI